MSRPPRYSDTNPCHVLAMRTLRTLGHCGTHLPLAMHIFASLNVVRMPHILCPALHTAGSSHREVEGDEVPKAALAVREAEGTACLAGVARPPINAPPNMINDSMIVYKRLPRYSHWYPCHPYHDKGQNRDFQASFGISFIFNCRHGAPAAMWKEPLPEAPKTKEILGELHFGGAANYSQR